MHRNNNLKCNRNITNIMNFCVCNNIRKIYSIYFPKKYGAIENISY